MKKRKINLKRISKIILFNLFFIFLLLEITLRIFNIAPYVRIIDLGHHDLFNLSDNKDLIYVPSLKDPRHAFRNGNGTLINSSFNKTKKRIFFIGDSVTEAIRIDDYKERFVEILDRKYDEYEIINAGVGGYNILQEKEYLKEKILKYNPDLVVFQITNNDLELTYGEMSNLNRFIKQDNKGEFYKEYYEVKYGIKKILYDLHTYRVYKYSFINKEAEEDIYYKINRNLLNKILDELIELSEKNNFDLVFIIFPVNIEHIYAQQIYIVEEKDVQQMYIIKEEAENKGIKVFDLNQYIHSNYSNKSFIVSLFFPRDPIHLSPKGQKIIAESLYKKENEWLIP